MAAKAQAIRSAPFSKRSIMVNVFEYRLFIDKKGKERIEYPNMYQWDSEKEYTIRRNRDYVLARKPALRMAAGLFSEYHKAELSLYKITPPSLKTLWSKEYDKKTRKDTLQEGKKLFEKVSNYNHLG